MDSSPRDGRVVRRIVYRPRVPRRAAPLTAARRAALVHGPLDVPGLAVRRPWWLTARRHLLRRPVFATPSAAGMPPTPATLSIPALAMPGMPATRALSSTFAAPAMAMAGPAAQLSRPSIVDPFGPRPEPLVPTASRRRLVAADGVAPQREPAVAAAGIAAGLPMAAPGPGRLAAALQARAAPLMTTAPPTRRSWTSALPGGTSVQDLGLTRTATVARTPLVSGRRPYRRAFLPPETVGAAQVGDLRVLGAAPVAAPAGGFDPAAALVATPPATAASPAAAHRATPPRMRPEPAPSAPGPRPRGPRPDPEVRWRAAVAARPLESPRPFPTALRPLVSAVTGGERASYTTGPATRQALAAAGAHGATTGSVVHLPAAPSPAPGPLLGVVAHELAHARNPVTRPRFLLEVPDGGADADERTALSVGRRFQSVAVGGGDAIRAGIVDELPVGGLGRVGGIAGEARAALTGNGGGALAGGGALSGAAALGGDAPSRDTRGGGVLSGGAALAEGASEGEPPDVSMPQVPGLGAAANWPGAGMPGADLTGAGGAGAAGAAMNAATGGAAPPSNVDIDRLADLLEQRLLKQIERRGGRYAGVF